MRKSFVLAWVLAAALVAAACSWAQREGGRNMVSSAQLVALLQKTAGNSLIPELGGAVAKDLCRREPGKSLLPWALEGAKEPIPVGTYTQYRQFRETGDRAPYQEPYFRKRELLTRAVLAIWLGGGNPEAAGAPTPADVSRVNDLIWNICEETSWVAPAHEKPEPWNIDLFAAETGADLAHIVLVLGDALPQEVRDRVYAEVDRRIFAPYLGHANDYGWSKGQNNWTGVCAGSIGETFLILEPDASRQAEGLALALEQLDRFIENAFETDGGCLEGIGYWNYGLIHFTDFAEMLRSRTQGAIDLLGDDKFKRIARYPESVALGKNAFASFADSHESSSLVPFLATRLAERTGVNGLRSLIGDGESSRFTTALRNILWWDGTTGPPSALENVFLPVSGIAKRVGAASGKPIVLAAKAGHNAEPHNNNDVGSFIVHAGDVTYLCDPGAGLYSRDYFGPKRYENIFTNSYGHSVPRIGGTLQLVGAAHKGTIEEQSDGALRIDFREAYNVPALKDAVRTLALREDGSIELTDQFRFDGAGLEVEEAFLTWLDVETAGGAARMKSETGSLEIRAADGAFAVERLEDACKANQKPEVLSRITATYPPSPQITARFTMQFTPNNQNSGNGSE